MSDAAPAFSFYAKDFILGTVTMSLAERGAYITLLAYQWDNGSVPDDPAARMRVMACSAREATTIWGVIRGKFSKSEDGQWRNPRLEKERVKQLAYRELQREKGKASARVRWQPDANQQITTVQPSRQPNGQPNSNSSFPSPFPFPKEEKEKSASLSSVSRDPFTDQTITERAGNFVRRYAELYPLHRFGARYAVKDSRDYAAAVTLCSTWNDDARLEKLAICFLTTDHKFAAEGSRTIPQFLALASWADGELAAWEKARA